MPQMDSALGDELLAKSLPCSLGGLVMRGSVSDTALGVHGAAPHSTGTGPPAPGFQGPALPATH